MTDLARRRLVALAAATLLASAAPLAAQTHAHDQHSAQDAPAKLALDHGRKWPTDAPLRAGMHKLRALVAPSLHAAQAGKLDAAQYAALAAKVEAEVGTIVARCKLPPQADAMLHLVIADLAAGADAMAGKDAARAPAAGLVAVAHALDDYGRYFNDAAYRPLHK